MTANANELFATLQKIDGLCRASLEQRKCFTCDEVLPLEQFYKRKALNQYFRECKSCLKKRRDTKNTK